MYDLFYNALDTKSLDCLMTILIIIFKTGFHVAKSAF